MKDDVKNLEISQKRNNKSIIKK